MRRLPYFYKNLSLFIYRYALPVILLHGLLATANAQIQNKVWPEPKHDLETCSYGYADGNGKWVIAPQYQEAERFRKQGLAIVKKAEKYGIIDTAGHIVVPVEYDYIGIGPSSSDNAVFGYYTGGYNFSGFFYLCYKNGLQGVINEYGTMVVAPTYQDIVYYYNDGSMAYRDNGNVFLNRYGKKVRLPHCYDIQRHNNYLIFRGYTERTRDKYGKYYGLADTAGNVIIPAEFYRISFYNDTLAVADSGVTILFNTNGKMLFSLPECTIYPLNGWGDELFYTVTNFYQHNKVGLADNHFKITLPIEYDDITPVRDSAAKAMVFIVRKDQKFGIVNSQNKKIVPLAYEGFGAYPIYEKGKGTFVVWERNYKKYRINISSGKVKYLPDDKIEKQFYENGKSLIWLKGKAGMVNNKNDTLLPMIYTWIGKPAVEQFFNFDKNPGPYKDWIYAEKDHKMVCIDLLKPGKEYDIKDVRPGKYNVFWGKSRYFNRNHHRWEWLAQSLIADQKGKTIFKTEEHLYNIILDKYVTQIVRYEKFILLNFKGRKVWKGEYLKIEEDTPYRQVFFVNPKGYCGMADQNLKIVVDSVYRGITRCAPQGYRIVSVDTMLRKNDRICSQGVLDLNGRTILPPIYYDCTHHTPWAFVLRNTKYKIGLISFDGKTELLPFEYDDVMFEENHDLWLRKQNRWYLYLSRQNRLLPEAYTRVRHFNNGVAQVWRGSQNALIDTLGKIISPFSYARLYTRGRDLFDTYIGKNDSSMPPLWVRSDNICTPGEIQGSGFVSRTVLNHGVSFEYIDHLNDEHKRMIINNFVLDTMSALFTEGNDAKGLQFISGFRLPYNSVMCGMDYDPILLPENRYTITIPHISPYTVSLAFHCYHGMGNERRDWTILQTYTIANDSLVPLHVTDLFMADSVLKNVSLLVWDSLKKIKNFDYDCANPEGIVDHSFVSFVLRPDGISFYISKERAFYYHYSRPFEGTGVTIPYTALKPYLKPGSVAWQIAGF